jgi:hypothetical protein
MHVVPTPGPLASATLRRRCAMTRVVLVRDPTDTVADSEPVHRAAGRLGQTLSARGVHVDQLTSTEGVEDDSIVVVLAGASMPEPRLLLSRAGASMPRGREAFAIADGGGGRQRLVVCGADTRGLVYATHELSDRVEHGANALVALPPAQPLIGTPRNAVRSVARLFCSHVEDLAWYRDEGFWRRYLAMLVAQRFNRFSLTFGLGYNFHSGVTDAYLYFAYPFLVSVPGYDVRVPQLPDDERHGNLAALRFISDEAAAVGLDFQLGLWTHAYQWIDSPDAHQTIEGLMPETHAAYCRDAVLTLLEACPSIVGLTFRIHGESGVPEQSWDFWRHVFAGVAACGRPVGIDLHAKGLDERTLGHALDTGLPVTVSPKFWAEHMGLPYHQAAIRESERAVRDDPGHRSAWHRYMRVSEGSRPWTRYGYGDFLREERPYDVVFRLWPGTQRLLLWGDPATAAGYGRVASVAGSQGLEWCEPLTFKGRQGSGVEGSRTGYCDTSLVPRDDWEKFAYAYRLFGRLSYDPEAPAEAWQPPLRAQFGPGALDAELALACASRILPLVTVAHHPSASNNYYWPELYTDMPIVWSEDGTRPHPYLDMPEPRRFGTVSPLDPEVFSSVADFVDELLARTPSGRVSPFDVVEHLDRLAEDADRHLVEFADQVSGADPEVRRWSADIAILASLGRFFAGKLRAAIWYELHTRTRSTAALQSAVEQYQAARRSWISASGRADGVYVTDLTFGPQQHLRGHWVDRVAAIDADLRDMEAQWRTMRGAATEGDHDTRVVDEAARPLLDVEIVHTPPREFRPDTELVLEVQVRGPDAPAVRRVTVRYRPMNQAVPYAVVDMHRAGDRFTGKVDADALDGDYPLAYAFVVFEHGRHAWRHPGLGEDLTSQPYFVVRPER